MFKRRSAVALSANELLDKMTMEIQTGNAHYAYTPFGEPLACRGVACSAYPFTGYLDRETDWESSPDDLSLRTLNLVHRTYVPKHGTFTTPDPLWTLSIGSSAYHYSNHDPVNISDPWGLNPTKPKKISNPLKPNPKEPKWVRPFYFGISGTDDYGDNSGMLREPTLIIPTPYSQENFMFAKATPVPGSRRYVAADGNLVIMETSREVVVVVEPETNESNWTYTDIAKAASAVLLLNDMSGVGVIDDLLIPALFIGAWVLDHPVNLETRGRKKSKGYYDKGDQIDLDRFSVEGKYGRRTNPKSGRYIEPDDNNIPHGGSHWKLYLKDGTRIGTLTKEGVWLRP